MVKQLISRKNRGGVACRFLIAAAFAGVVATWAGDAFAATTCYDVYPNEVPCTDPTPWLCKETTDYGGECPALGFTYEIPQGFGFDWCFPGRGQCGGAAVPELEDYAAAAFITLALLIGWRVRQKCRPAI